jgi:hypothetical protein
MKRNVFKTLVILLLLTAAGSSVHAQYGFGTSAPNASSVVDMVSGNKGVLLPRVHLTSPSLAAPVVSPADYLVVYNEATDGDVSPGLYYWKPATSNPISPTAWVRMHNSTGSVGINTAAPNASAVLDISSTTQGLLPPRMTSAQIAAITNPAQGLMVYNTDMHCLMYYADATFRCSYVTTVTNQGTIVAGSAAPSFTGIANTMTFPYLGSTATATPVGYAGSSPQGTALYQWFRYDDAAGTINPTVIPGAIASTYKLTVADVGKYIRVSAQPVATTGTSPGASVFATTLLGPVWTCGNDLTITHRKDDGMSPVLENQDITYKTVLYNSQCWLGQNLGATSVAVSFNDASDASAGWYWQHNNKRGYSSGTSISPVWITGQSSGGWDKNNDPCFLLLGDGWAVPTKAQMNVYIGTTEFFSTLWGGVLNLHMGGYRDTMFGSRVNRGSNGYFGLYEGGSMGDKACAVYQANPPIFYPSHTYVASNEFAAGAALSVRCVRSIP